MPARLPEDTNGGSSYVGAFTYKPDDGRPLHQRVAHSIYVTLPQSEHYDAAGRTHIPWTGHPYNHGNGEGATISVTQYGCKVSVKNMRGGGQPCEAWSFDEDGDSIEGDTADWTYYFVPASKATTSEPPLYGGYQFYDYIQVAGHNHGEGSWYCPFTAQGDYHANDHKALTAVQLGEIGRALLEGAELLDQWDDDWNDAAMRSQIQAGGDDFYEGVGADCECWVMTEAEEEANIEGWDGTFSQLCATADTLRDTMRRNATALTQFKDMVVSGDIKAGDPIRVSTDGTEALGSGYTGNDGTTGNNRNADAFRASTHAINEFMEQWYHRNADETTYVTGMGTYESDGSDYYQVPARTLHGAVTGYGAETEAQFLWRAYYHNFEDPASPGNPSVNSGRGTTYGAEGGDSTTDYEWWPAEAAMDAVRWPRELAPAVIDSHDSDYISVPWTTSRGALESYLIARDAGTFQQYANDFISTGGTDSDEGAGAEARSRFADYLFYYFHVAKKYRDYMADFKATLGTGSQEELQTQQVIDALDGYLTAIMNMAKRAEKEMCFMCSIWAEADWYADRAEAHAAMQAAFPGQWNRDLNQRGQRERATALRTEAARRDVASGRDIQVPPFFREQCFLLAQMPYFATYKKEVIDRAERKRLPYMFRTTAADAEDHANAAYLTDESNACLMMDGDPFGFINRLTQYESFANIMNVKTSEIANLQPLIRIYKILIDEDGEETQMEIPFDSHFTSNDLELFRNQNNRGQGVGIKDFTFSFEADNPFAVKKSIKARLTIFANNFSELLRTRWVPIDNISGDADSAEEFKYVDLALKTGTGKSFSIGSLDPNQADVVVANLNKLDFRIKAVVGWNYRSSWGGASATGGFQLGADDSLHTLSNELRGALYDAFITLNLTPVIHEFDIDEQGRVVFKIDYLAYVEDFFDSPAFNIFPNVSVDSSLLPGERHSMELYTESARAMRDIKTQAFASECNSDQMSILKEELATEVEIYRVESMRSIIRDMQWWGYLRFVNLTSNDVYEFRRAGPNWSGIDNAISGENLADVGIASTGVQTYSEGTSASTIVTEEIVDQLDALGLEEEDKNRRLRALAATGADSQIQPVSFFYVDNLIDCILAGMSSKYAEGFSNSVLAQLIDLQAEGAVSAQYNFSPGSKMREALDAKIIRYRQMDTQMRKLRILLGPMELVHQGNFQSEFFSLGDVPISVKYFIEWLSKKMSDRDEVYYPLPKFINELINDLCRDILNDSRCFRNQAKQRIRTNQAALSSYKVDVSDKYPVLEETFRGQLGSAVDPVSGEIEGDMLDEITADLLMFRMSTAHTSRVNINYYGTGDPYFPAPAIAVAGSRGNPSADEGIENMIDWLVYYAGRTQPVEKMNGVEAEDARYGIFHYCIGLDRGITKKIKLKKTDTTGLKELRFEQEGYDGLKQLREVFDVTIETYANVQAYPGLYVFVDPAGFSPNSTIGDSIVDLTQIGIGGYHMIIRSEHSFGPGYANSKIDAKWVASTHAIVTEDQPGQAGSEGESRSDIGTERYCFAAEQRQQERQAAAEREQEQNIQAQIDAGSGTWELTSPSTWGSAWNTAMSDE